MDKFIGERLNTEMVLKTMGLAGQVQISRWKLNIISRSALMGAGNRKPWHAHHQQWEWTCTLTIWAQGEAVNWPIFTLSQQLQYTCFFYMDTKWHRSGTYLTNKYNNKCPYFCFFLCPSISITVWWLWPKLSQAGLLGTRWAFAKKGKYTILSVSTFDSPQHF